MPDDTTYSRAATVVYVPPVCPDCGKRTTQAWVEVGSFAQPDRFVKGRLSCPTPGCEGVAKLT